MMRNRHERIQHGRRAVRERGRPERRLAGGRDIQLPLEGSHEWSVVLGRKLHEQTMRMLTIVNCVAPADLTRREEIRIPAAPNRPRFCTQHRPYGDTTSAPDARPFP